MTTLVPPELINDLEDADIENTSSVTGATVKDALDTLDGLTDPTVNIIGSIGGGTQDIDLDLGRAISGTVDTSTTTFTFSNPRSTGNEDGFTLYLTNGGSQTVNWPASVDWAGGTAPTLTTAGFDLLVFTTIDGGTIWHGALASGDSK